MNKFFTASLLLFYSLLMATPPVTDQWELKKKTASGFESYGLTAENGKAIGFTAGVPAMITVGSGSGSGTVTSVAVSGSDGIEIDSGSPITTAGTIALGINASTLKTHLSLNNVENTALSTWTGATSITTLGTVSTGVWNGTAIGDSYISSAATWSAKQAGDATLTALAGAGTANTFPYFSATDTIANGSITAAGLALLDDTDASAQRTTLGLGTLATQSGTFSGTSSGTNTGDNAVNSLYSGLVSNATHTGDATGATALTVVGINGTILSTLGTGILKNTTSTGVPSIAVAGDFPTLNQNTTGNAGTATALATARAINGVDFDGTAAITVTAAAGTLSGDTLASNVLASSLTSVGTIATGVWNGSIIGSSYGGAGTVSGILKADGAGTVSAAASGTDYEPPVTFSTGLTDTANTITVDQALAPTWTGIHTFTPTARTSGSASYFVINTPADTGLTAATESVGVKFTGATRTFADGTIALQRERYFSAPTYNKTTTSATITDVFNLYLDKPVNGTGVTFTRPHTLGIVDATSASSSITGGLIVATTLGTSATSVGIGGGNVYMGGNLSVGGTQTHTGALTQTGAATFNGVVTQTTTARSSGSAAYYTLTTPADTNATLSTEHIGAHWTAATRQHATGALTLQRERVFAAPTYSFVGASTLTTAINVDIADPIQGTNATITNAYSLRAANVLFTGVIKAGSGPTTLTDSTGKVLSAALNTVAVANGGTGTTTLDDLITLGTHTTGNYMTDVSGTANEISVSHTPGEGSTATLSLPADIDLGGKTSFEIPNGAAPTVDAFGEFAGDNDLWAASRGAPVFFDGTASVALIGALVSDTPSNGQVPVWNTGGTITWEANGSGAVATDTIWDAKGDLVGGTGSNTAAKLTVGTNGYILTADSVETTGMKWAPKSETIIIACSDETTALTTGAGKVTFRMPFAMTLTAVRASAGTAPTGSTISIGINESGGSILSTDLTIDVSEKTSTTAATAAVISDSTLADDAEITIDLDQVGSTIAGAGLKVTLIGTR